MGIYIFLWALLLILSFVNGDKKKYFIFILLFIILVFISGGRLISIGVDTKTYLEVFNNIISNGYITYLEPTWNIINILVGKVTSNFNVFMIIISALTLLPIFFVSKKESKYIFFPIFIYVSMHLFTGSFNMMRQYMGFSYVLLSYYFLSHDNKKYFYLFALISTSIHYSSIFVFALVLHKFIPINSKKIILLLIFSFLFGSMMNEQVLSKLPLFKFQTYISGDGLYKDNLGAAIIMTFLMNSFAVIIISTYRGIQTNEFWYKVFIFSIIVLNLTYTLEYGTRLYNLFSISHIIFIPMYLSSNRIKQKSSTYTFIILFYAVLFFRMLLNDGNQVIPYNNVFM